MHVMNSTAAIFDLIALEVEKQIPIIIHHYRILMKDGGYIGKKDADDRVARKEETGKAKKEVYGCGERGHGWR